MYKNIYDDINLSWFANITTLVLTLITQPSDAPMKLQVLDNFVQQNWDPYCGYNMRILLVLTALRSS